MQKFSTFENFKPKKVDERYDVYVDDGNNIEENEEAVKLLQKATEIKSITLKNEDDDNGQLFCDSIIVTDAGVLYIEWQMGISRSMYNAMDQGGYESVLKKLKRAVKKKEKLSEKFEPKRIEDRKNDPVAKEILKREDERTDKLIKKLETLLSTHRELVQEWIHASPLQQRALKTNYPFSDAFDEDTDIFERWIISAKIALNRLKK